VPTPAGQRFTQPVAAQLARAEHLVFACGRYEGIDQRVVTDAATRMPVLELSIGDYVLAGGEVAAMVMVEAITRLLPGVLGNPDSAVDDSFSGSLEQLVEAPSYTRPPVYRGLPVPAVLTGGDHAAVAAYRREESRRRTTENRPDLLIQ
jgi:tRNA (guanine37-N1)-methyltransferase